MKNITISVDEDTYRNARIKAAEADTSVSALVRSFLIGLSREQSVESDFDRLRRLQDETLERIRARGGGLSSADNSGRDAVHEE